MPRRIHPEVRPVIRSVILVVSALLSFLSGPPPAEAGVLTLSIVSGLTDLLGGTEIQDPVGQESLSGSTLAQLGSPLVFDPEMDMLTSLTVRVTNTSGAAVLFPEFLPGVSVLSGLNSIPGYSSKLNVGAGGAAGKTGLPGADGAISRTVLDTAYDLLVEGSAGTVSNGGGGGAGTAVADNWISLKGASGEELSPYLAGKELQPGEWVDIPGFASITAFHRAVDDARFAFGFDLPTFNSGGISVTTGAWTGSCSGPHIEAPPPVTGPPAAVPEPASVTLLLGGLALGATRRRFARPRQ
jgi:PEP-CTERM motif-containing protein